MADHFLEQQLPYQKDILQQGLPICPISLQNLSIKFSNIRDGFRAFASKADALLVGCAAEMAG